MASQSADPGGDRNQDTVAYVPQSHSLVERLNWHHSTRVSRSHVVLRPAQISKINCSITDLLQPPSQPSLTARANAGYASVTTRRQSARVSLAATLSRLISDTHGRLSLEMCAFLRFPWAKTEMKSFELEFSSTSSQRVPSISRFSDSVDQRQEPQSPAGALSLDHSRRSPSHACISLPSPCVGRLFAASLSAL